jgi:bifunctional DNase/RNase
MSKLNKLDSDNTEAITIKDIKDKCILNKLESKIKNTEKELDYIVEKIKNLNIKKQIKTRDDNMEMDIGKMLNNILEKFRKKIDLVAIQVMENDHTYIEVDVEENKKKIKEHFENWTCNREIDIEIIESNKEWKEIYGNNNDIKEEWYENLMNEISIEELNDVIRSTSNNKAAGKSGITYEFWKHSKDYTKELLRIMINQCLEDEEMIEAWKKGLIYPISKSCDWNKNLNLTRPITLIETARKLLTKILTQRLSNTISERNI